MATEELNEETARQHVDRFVSGLELEQPPVNYSGRGVVICGGGPKYFVCAWVCINLLRRHGCTLPVQLWHLAGEISAPIRQLLEPLGVVCVDATAMRRLYPVRTLNGWELKAYAILYSDFREVLLIDADNVPVKDPSFLFETSEFRRYGALFWPDYGRINRDRLIWRLTGVPYRDEPEFESGQIVVDKQRCWKPLRVAMWMNEYSDFWYRYIHGDKETFHFAWRVFDAPYGMPARAIESLTGTMCQHDFNGQRLFQHRNLRKWTLAHNETVDGFEQEAACLEIIETLRPHHRLLRNFPTFDEALSAPLLGTCVEYHRVGYDRRVLRFEADGTIAKGADRMEQFWGIRTEGLHQVLEIYGEDGVTACLVPNGIDGKLWKGYWMIHERMPVEITLAASDGSGVRCEHEVLQEPENAKLEISAY